MPRPIVHYVRFVEAVNRLIGRFAMLIIFGLMGVLLVSSFSRTALNLSFIWTVEVAQFMLAAFYLLGGGYSMQLGSHVRMDLLYSRWSPRGQALADAITSFFLIFYLVVLLLGAISSTQYALEYGQRNFSSWAPPLSPIKIVMTFGITLMLLQAVAMFFRAVATARGDELE
jgi:TRAP-type mannitol/chloroaromatic compound transport system permease small subunit